MKRLLFVCLGLCLSASLLAVEVPRVVDETGSITRHTKGTLTNLLGAEEQRSGNQVMVYITGSLNGGDIADVANKVFKGFGLGHFNANNGVLFIVAKKEKQFRIEVGYGLEDVLTDARCRHILGLAANAFRAGNYDVGSLIVVTEILNTLKQGN